MAGSKQKTLAPPTPAPIAAINAAKKMPTTLGGQIIGPDGHAEDVIMAEIKGGKGPIPHIG